MWDNVGMSRTKARKAPLGRGDGSSDVEPPPLSRAQVRELARRVRDLDDRTRYLLASALTAKHTLYYDVSEDTYVMDNPAHGTQFKRRAAAMAIQGLLSSRVRIVECRVSRSGRLILSSVPRLRPTWLRSAKRAGTRKGRHA